eukprot:255321-Chlamydomonas_euryale.AAC.1
MDSKGRGGIGRPPARGDLLVTRVDQVCERRKRVGRGEPRVAVARHDVHRGVDHDGVDQLRDGHGLHDVALVVIRHVLAVLLLEVVDGVAGLHLFRRGQEGGEAGAVQSRRTSSLRSSTV